MGGEGSLVISVDELCMAAILEGRSDFARGFLFSVLGSMEDMETKGRLLAASDSLMSKGLIKYDVDSNKPKPIELLTRIVNIITSPSFLIRVSKTETDREETVIYHFSNTGILEQKVQDGLVYILNLLDSQRDVISSGLRFFDFDKAMEFSICDDYIPYNDLEKAKTMATENPEEIERWLTGTEIDKGTIELLSQDLRESRYRGAVMRVDYKEEELVSNKGFILLGGNERVWIFSLLKMNGKTVAKIISGTEEDFTKETEKLFSD